MKPKPTDRAALYAEVWAEPVTVVAKRYGLSDVGLMKTCERMSIPVPRRGYWAKVKAGHPAQKAPLPELEPSARVAAGPTPLTDPELELRRAAQEAAASAKRSLVEAALPAETVDIHPLVKAAGIRLHRKSGWDHHAGLRSAEKEVLNICVTEGSVERALQLVNLVIQSVVLLGFSIRLDTAKGETYLDGRGVQLEVSISEHVARSNHVATESEERALKRYHDSWRNVGYNAPYPTIPRYDWTPSNRLTIKVGRYCSRSWSDTPRTRLEQRLPEVIAGIVAVADATRQREEEERARDRRQREARERYEAAVQLRRNERAGYLSLVRKASMYRRANNLRDFLAEFERSAINSGGLTDQDREWIEWARAKADWIDPLIDVSDRILDAPKPVSPNYWEL